MANTGDPLGCDIYCTTDWPLQMRLVSGQENLAAASLRRLNCDEGRLATIGDTEDYGYNLVAQLNNDYAPGELSAIGKRVSAELEKDPRHNRVESKLMLGQG